MEAMSHAKTSFSTLFFVPCFVLPRTPQFPCFAFPLRSSQRCRHGRSFSEDLEIVERLAGARGVHTLRFQPVSTRRRVVYWHPLTRTVAIFEVSSSATEIALHPAMADGRDVEVIAMKMDGLLIRTIT